MNGPEAEYESRLAERRSRVDREKANLVRLGNARLLYAAVAVVCIWLIASNGIGIWPVLALGALLVLVAMLVFGERLERRARFAQRAADYYAKALNRVRHRSNPGGETGSAFFRPITHMRWILISSGNIHCFNSFRCAAHVREKTCSRTGFWNQQRLTRSGPVTRQFPNCGIGLIFGRIWQCLARISVPAFTRKRSPRGPERRPFAFPNFSELVLAFWPVWG